jgi:phosphohistidine phosphatase
MEIYIVQHAESRSKEEDPRRPLTDKGFNDIEKMAYFARNNAGMTIRKIYHSGKLRARQTADALAASLRPVEGVEETDGLEPMADPAIWAERISKSEGDIMLVGHLPHLAGLAGMLLSGDKTKNPINFHNAGIVKLVRDSEMRWFIDWIVVDTVVGSKGIPGGSQ